MHLHFASSSPSGVLLRDSEGLFGHWRPAQIEDGRPAWALDVADGHVPVLIAEGDARRGGCVVRRVVVLDAYEVGSTWALCAATSDHERLLREYAGSPERHAAPILVGIDWSPWPTRRIVGELPVIDAARAWRRTTPVAVDPDGSVVYLVGDSARAVDGWATLADDLRARVRPVRSRAERVRELQVDGFSRERAEAIVAEGDGAEL